jgi:hypothetical protein
MSTFNCNALAELTILLKTQVHSNCYANMLHQYQAFQIAVLHVDCAHLTSITDYD